MSLMSTAHSLGPKFVSHHKCHLKLRCLGEMTRPASVSAGVRASQGQDVAPRRRPPGVQGKSELQKEGVIGLCAGPVKT